MNHKRILIANTSLIFIFVLLGVRLFDLQIWRHDEYSWIKRRQAFINSEWDVAINKKLNNQVQNILNKAIKEYPEINETLIIVSQPSTGNILAIARHNQWYVPLLEAKPIIFLILSAGGIEQKSFDIEQTKLGALLLKEYFLSPSKITNEALSIYAQNLGINVLTDYFSAFGIGQGSDLLWRPIKEASFDLQELIDKGEGVFLSPFQISRIVGITANKGSFRNSHIILKGSADIIARILKENVKYGSAVDIGIVGYEIGGIEFSSDKSFSDKNRNSCLVGFIDNLPRDQRIVVLTMTHTKSNTIDVFAINKKLFHNTVVEVIRHSEN